MKVCFVGTGSIGKRHITNLYNICIQNSEDLTVHVLRNTNRQLDSCLDGMVNKQLFSFNEMDDYYDAIFICNPTFKHYEIIEKLKAYSRYFFVEKPIFDNTEYELEKLKIPENNKYYVACPLRYTEVLLTAKKILEEEDVIGVRAISSSYLPNWRSGVDYRKTYSAKKEEGGGVHLDLIHEWDYLTYLFGFPLKVMSIKGKYSDLDITSEDTAVYIAEYSDKLLELHLDYWGKETKRYFEVWTNSTEYIFDICNKRILKDGKVYEEYKENVNEMYVKEMKNFLDIVKGKKSNNTLLHAYKVLHIAINNSIG